MNDIIAPKRSSLRPKLVEAVVFLKLNISSILNHPEDFAESPIWNTLISSCPELPDDIDDSDDKENEEEDDGVEEEEDDEDDDLSPMPIESEEANYTRWF